MTEKAYRGKHIDVEVRDGKEVVVHGPAVAIVAVDVDRHVTLVRQERVGAGRKLLELPAGNVDEGEAPLVTAKRELREETGLHGGDWVDVATVYTTPGFCDERMHLFVATELTRGEPSPEGSEELELVRVPTSALPRLLPEIDDAKTLAGLLLYLYRRGPGAAPTPHP